MDTPKTKVNVGLPSFGSPKGSSADTKAVPYAKPLRKVAEQQTKVAKYIGRNDWDEVVEKTSDWNNQVRELMGYASTSHDPRLFRDCCDQLLEHVQALRQAALRRNADQVRQAFDRCDPPLNRLVRSFPSTNAPPPARTPPSADRGAPPPTGKHMGSAEHRNPAATVP